MKPITPFNYWIINKIMSYLSSKQGCTSQTPEYTDEGIKTIVRDAFGYVYEIRIKTIGRNTSDLEVIHEKLNYLQNVKMATTNRLTFE